MEKFDKIVFIDQSSGYIIKEVINVFCTKYTDVSLIAGRISKSGSPLDSKVKISKITPYRKSIFIMRLHSWIWGTIQALFLIKIKYRRYHLFITSNPPTLFFLPLICKNKYSLLILDVYPDGLIAGGFVKPSSCLFRLWKRLNRATYKRAQNIYTLTESMANTMSEYVERERIQVVAPWSMFTMDSKMKKEENKFILAHNLTNSFIVMYSGNIGLGHNVESLIEVARLLDDNKHIKFIIIGDGWQKPLIERKVEEYKLSNCILLPLQSPEMFRYSLPAADIGVVSVTDAADKVCSPSKLYNLIGLEIPLLCIADPVSELGQFVVGNRIGGVFRRDQFKSMADFIFTLWNDPVKYSAYLKNLEETAQKFTVRNSFNYLSNFKTN